ncbi:MAG: glutathione S-transferase family protein [Gammaproteobacteria bacterium]
MSIQLYDLAGADPRLLFSPFSWRVRMALLHKGLEFEVVPWRFSAREAIAASGHPSVPVIRDGDTWVGDSWEIACYLDRRYPERPRLMPPPSGTAHARLVAALCGTLIFPAAVQIGVYQAYRLLDPRCQPYFRESREAMFNTRLEDLHADASRGPPQLAAALKPFDEVLNVEEYLGGPHATYADFLLFGILKWLDIVSAYAPLDRTTPSGRWFTRLEQDYGGHAGQVPRARQA